MLHTTSSPPELSMFENLSRAWMRKVARVPATNDVAPLPVTTVLDGMMTPGRMLSWNGCVAPPPCSLSVFLRCASVADRPEVKVIRDTSMLYLPL